MSQTCHNHRQRLGLKCSLALALLWICGSARSDPAPAGSGMETPAPKSVVPLEDFCRTHSVNLQLEAFVTCRGRTDRVIGVPVDAPRISRILVDLNGDNQPEVFLRAPRIEDVFTVDFYPYVSTRHGYLPASGGNTVDLMPLWCWAGTLPDRNVFGILNCDRIAKDTGLLTGFYLDGATLRSEVLKDPIDLSDRPSGGFLEEMNHKYKQLKVERIPMALMDTLEGVRDLEPYLEQREKQTYAAPLRDFAQRHARPYGRSPVDGEKEVLRVRCDLNGDGHPEVFLSTGGLTARDTGNLWEVFLSEGDRYRWRRAGVMFKPDLKVRNREMVSWASGGLTLTLASITMPRSALQVEVLAIEDRKETKDDPLSTLGEGYTPLIPERIPLSDALVSEE